jgi:hypothetical protein
MRLLLAVLSLAVLSQALRFAPRMRTVTKGGVAPTLAFRTHMCAFDTSLAMSEGDGDLSGGKSGQEDVSKYTVGQTLSGALVSSKDFGIFVQIEGSKTRVLLPRSLLSRGEYSKLTSMVASKASISFDIASVDTEKKTLSGTYNSGVDKKDVSSITDADIKNTEYPATVVGCHDFGVFVELDG